VKGDGVVDEASRSWWRLKSERRGWSRGGG